MYNINLKTKLRKNYYDGVLIAVSHDKFKSMGINTIYNLCKNHVIYDLKNLFTSKKIDLRL